MHNNEAIDKDIKLDKDKVLQTAKARLFDGKY